MKDRHSETKLLFPILFWESSPIFQALM